MLPPLAWYTGIRYNQVMEQDEQVRYPISIGIIIGLEGLIIVLLSPLAKSLHLFGIGKTILMSSRILLLFHVSSEGPLPWKYLLLIPVGLIFYNPPTFHFYSFAVGFWIDFTIMLFSCAHRNVGTMMFVMLDLLRIIQRFYWRSFILRGFGGAQVINLVNGIGIRTENQANMVLEMIIELTSMLTFFTFCIPFINKPL